MKILAKSDGTTLIDHSNMVSKVAKMIYSELMRNSELNNNHLIALEFAGKLHDIGKCTKNFQKKLKTNQPEEEIVDLIKRVPYRHNEVGWAFLAKYLNLPKELNSMILDMVYWHHGISNKLSSYNNFELLSRLEQSDVDTMLEYLNEVVPSEYINSTPELVQPKTAPTYYTNDEDTAREKNMIQTLLRASLNSADRLSSKVGYKEITIDEVKDIIFNDIFDTSLIDVTKHQFYGNERFKLQESIPRQVNETTIIKAPAGFGKTLLGLLWMIHEKKKILWVCPRNVVATSVYYTITQELKSFGATDVKVEVFVTGNVTMSTHPTNGFESDIIITNIDNYLAPSVDNRHSHRLCDILNSHVIFDEWHEFVGEAAMFSCFINIMRIRHNMTKAKTILLSATPVHIDMLWNSINRPTLVLPNTTSHYPAPHKQPYLLNIVKILSPVDNSSSLVVYNSIQNVQLNKTPNSNIIHSWYIDSHKAERLNQIYQLYGKSTPRDENKQNLYAGPLIRASLDISFKHLMESVISPQYTLQAIGRCNRFGDYQNQCTINLANLFDTGENNLKDIFYDRNLTGIWFEFIKSYDGKLITLDELYVAYNKFENDNKINLSSFNQRKHLISLNNLVKIHPVKYFEKKGKSDVKTIGSNKLRAINDGIFITAKNHDEETYCDTFSTELYGGISEQFDERQYDVNVGKMIRCMKAIRNMGDTRFDYNEIIDDKFQSMDIIRKAAKKSTTPYIRFDVVYHKVYGLIKLPTLYKIFFEKTLQV